MSAADLDPGAPIPPEVERGMASLIEQHSKWLELAAAAQRGEEFDWRTAELLSCLRAIEWDLQDLEDAVSIVEGAPEKFSLDDDAVKVRKDFIDTIRTKISHIRAEVQDYTSNEGHIAAKRGLAAKAHAAVTKGYGKLPKEQGEPTEALPSTPKGADADSKGSGKGTFVSDGDSGRGGVPDADHDGDPRRRARAWYAWCC